MLLPRAFSALYRNNYEARIARPDAPVHAAPGCYRHQPFRKAFQPARGAKPTPYALYSFEFTASHRAVKRRSAQTDMNRKLCERIANAEKVMI